MSRPYRPFDQEKHLGDPPWSGKAVEDWEEAHGHDARLECYPEYGCMCLAAEGEAWEDLVWDIMRADPPPGLPRTTLHIDVPDERPCIVIYYTKVELSETQAEMVRDLILERSIRDG